MSVQGRPIFQRYITQTLKTQAQADAIAQRQYLGSLHALVAAPTLNFNAISSLINQRKQAEAGATAAIRSFAFDMLRTLPSADQKLALTAIFADARLPSITQDRAAPTAAKPSVRDK